MPFRFFAAIGAPGALARLREELQHKPAKDWELHAATPSLLLLAPRDAPVTVLTGSRGAILGSVIGSAGSSQPLGTDGNVEDMERSEGKSLLETSWGAYVVLLARDPSKHVVLRDPSGAVSVYHWRHDSIDCYASDLGAAPPTASPPSAIDARFVRHWLSHPYLRSARTGRMGVTELLPGSRRRLAGGNATIDTPWSPWRFTARDMAVTDPEAAALSVRRSILQSLAHLPLPEPRLLQLSGGLDSSILAVGLAAVGRRFNAVTFATRSAEGDERAYARMVAARSGGLLSERVLDEPPLKLDLSPEAGFRPGRNPLLDPLQAAVEDEASALGATQIIGGAGGDNVFCALTTTAPVIDAWRGEGLAAAWRTLGHIARRGDATLWRTGRYAVAKALRRDNSGWRADASLLHPDAFLAAPDSHPWLEAPPDVPVGKREHVAAIVHIQHFLDRRHSPTFAAVHPLLAQPVMEACLRVPTWLWVDGGRDRAIARSAFADLLPPRVVERRSKGSLQGLFVRRFNASRPALRDLLLGGELAERRILDSAAVDAALAHRPTTDSQLIRLTELAAMELWLRSSVR